ncbi:MAG: alpha-amylase family protein [Spirochaetota bacterium]
MHKPKWAIFYDFHTQPDQPDVGERFDVEAATDKWKECGVDYVVFHARCNLGMAYYDTKVGIHHPSLKYDLFGKLAEACRKKNIALTAYLNAGLSHEEGLLHRDWCALTPEGYTYVPPFMGHWTRHMCYNTGYTEHLLAMIREVASNYPVAGFFLDCFSVHECIGVECIREMKAKGIDWSDKNARYEFAHMSQIRLAKKIRDTALAARPDLLLYFNGVNFEDQKDIGTYLEYECLPTGGWGYEQLPVYARYMRTLGKPVLNMTGRFHRSWGDFGGIRTEPSLEYDCMAGIANGMRTTIGDHWHPRGDMNNEVFDLIKRIYGRLQKLEPYIDDAQALTDTAVVVNRDFGDNVLGAVRMLAELKVQFDVVTSASQWKDYRLLVIPDSITLDDDLAKKVRAHIAKGGAVIASGTSGMDAQKKEFFDEWGITYTGEDAAPDIRFESTTTSNYALPYPAYFRAGKTLAAGLPDMPLNCYVRGIQVTPGKGTEILAHCMSSYFPRHWDGEHHHLYIPPENDIDRAFITRKGNIVHITHPIFTAYHQSAPVPLKQLVANIMAMLHPTPLIRTENLPSFARVTVTEQKGRRMVYMMNYVPERRGASVDMIEEAIESRDVKLSIRNDGRTVKKAYLAPSGEKLDLTVKDGYALVTVPIVKGWAVVVFEE